MYASDMPPKSMPLMSLPLLRRAPAHATVKPLLPAATCTHGLHRTAPAPDGTVFVELKKKFKGTVYKRRVQTTAERAEAWLSGRTPAPENSQVCREIDWFLHMHSPAPKIFIACDREAYIADGAPELRFTFDRGIRWREEELSLCDGTHGTPLLDGGQVLMEIKIPNAAPLWLAGALSRLEVFPTGFSKYGSCYKSGLVQKYFDGVITIA